MALLEVKDLRVSYGVIEAIKGISFEVNEGEIVTLIGANGAGKTTTMQSIMGLIHPKSGTITFDGADIFGMSTHKILRLGMTQVPEGRRIFSELTVYENLLMGAYIEKTGKRSKKIWKRFMKSSPGSTSAARRWRARSPAANSKCWPWAGP